MFGSVTFSGMRMAGVLLLAAGVCGCGGGFGIACGPPTSVPATYELRGQVLAIRADTSDVLIRHEDIKGFMPGMTMPFKVTDPRLLNGIRAGDLVTATLVVGNGPATVSAITRTGTAPIPDDAPRTISAAAGVTLLVPGSAAPLTTLVDQDEGPLSLLKWKGSAVAVTFIYTRCPLPQFCPLLDRRFAEVQRLVRDDAALRGRVRLLSVSFDPEHDSPAVLRAHAQKLGADPAVWRFASGPPEVVDRFAAEFGVNVIREQDTTMTHNVRTTVIDVTGKVSRLFDDNNWSAADLVEALRHAS